MQHIPACNGECLVDLKHSVVSGAVQYGWSHRKAPHQTWGGKQSSCVRFLLHRSVRAERRGWWAIVPQKKKKHIWNVYVYKLQGNLWRRTQSLVLNNTQTARSWPTHSWWGNAALSSEPTAAKTIWPWFITAALTALAFAWLLWVVSNVAAVPGSLQASISICSDWVQPIISISVTVTYAPPGFH